MPIAVRVGTHLRAMECGRAHLPHLSKAPIVNRFIWLVGAVVIVIAVLSFFGLR
jgi:ABC-type dipeptide/oligopeptide/nickel transport system permease subunit